MIWYLNWPISSGLWLLRQWDILHGELYSPIDKVVRQELPVPGFVDFKDFDGGLARPPAYPPHAVIIDCLPKPCDEGLVTARFILKQLM